MNVSSFTKISASHMTCSPNETNHPNPTPAAGFLVFSLFSTDTKTAGAGTAIATAIAIAYEYTYISSQYSITETRAATSTTRSETLIQENLNPRYGIDSWTGIDAIPGSLMATPLGMLRGKNAAGEHELHVSQAPPPVCPVDDEAIDLMKKAGVERGDEAGAEAVGANPDVKVLNTRNLDYILKSGLAGGMAGCAAKTVVGPLDRVKILFQTSNPQFARYSTSWFGVARAMQDINRNEGMRGLFKGHSATLLRIFPYAAIKFLAYEQIRAIVIPSRGKETPFRRLISGSLAGITSVFFTYPLEVMRVHLAFETKHGIRASLRRICRQIYNEGRPGVATATATTRATSAPIPPTSSPDGFFTNSPHPPRPVWGLSNFYRGFSPTLLGMLPYAGMSFLTHDTMGDLLRHPILAPYTTIPHSENLTTTTTTTTASSSSSQPQPYKHVQLKASAELFSGAVAGLVSQTSSYPLEVIRRRMQVAGTMGDGHKVGIAETARRIFAEKGFRGFWVGLTIGYMKVVPMVATSFFVYERAKWWLGI
ncbi:coenzyme A transporter [Paracoccidioides brasiliensis Pb18]|uniref:Mitochondrial thiamine pyrophosphate carrier 1 n=1 Tax=Paracoccidioides brasiliensis (strain Pb18) TaxID=502780 RepID=C1FZ13_PARBD|nr:coenzyme A transporter [Paracoccidioides brasiliensis Pb18]EEH44750.1 hypothetical protein PADG_01039 [Paracoccidioides brasiliensis Pb18]